MQPQEASNLALSLPGTAPLRLNGLPYRGQLQASVANGALRAVNNVGLEAYLFGVVPSEMPYTWLPEALKAQAVAARSYALAVRKTGGWFGLYPDTREPGLPRHCRCEGVDDDGRERHRRRGRPLRRPHRHDVLLSSSSGGRTAAANEVWPSSPEIAYLVSVDDPYDTTSPHHQWEPCS